MQTLSHNIVTIEISRNADKQIDDCISLRLDICNHGDTVHVNRIFIISYESEFDMIPFDRFIEFIKQGRSVATLTIDLTKSKLQLNMNKIQFIFITSFGNITSNCIRTDQFV